MPRLPILPRPSTSTRLLFSRLPSIRPLTIYTATRFPTSNKTRSINRISPCINSPQLIQSQGFAQASSSGKSQADLLVEELQELYETAKDEFEIATDSTDSATIYAASDRDSARDALNQLIAVYSLYTTDILSTAESHGPQQTQQGDSEGQLVTTNFDPADIAPEVREEVRKRVAHRLRELENAVEALEERAHAE